MVGLTNVFQVVFIISNLKQHISSLKFSMEASKINVGIVCSAKPQICHICTLLCSRYKLHVSFLYSNTLVSAWFCLGTKKQLFKGPVCKIKGF